MKDENKSGMGAPEIDFHSPEFNRTDDLNDTCGNYRCFEPLNDVVTADMRHQMDRRCQKDTVDSSIHRVSSPEETEGERYEHGETDPGPLTIISRGRTLIIDTDPEHALACGNLLNGKGLSCTLVITEGSSVGTLLSDSSRPPLLRINAVSVMGSFGGFSLSMAAEDSQKHGTGGFTDGTVFDLVLDLQPIPSYVGACLPMGYYAPGSNPAALDEALAELPEMRGRFRKPQFVSFLKAHCFHDRGRAPGCCKCLEICPFGAIHSDHRKIAINHYRCEGCGACALVCPAGAFRMVQPSCEELLNRLQGALQGRFTSGRFALSLAIYDSEGTGNSKTTENSNDHTVHFEVDHIAYADLAVLLTVLAYGAQDVLVVCGQKNPPAIRKAVQWQVRMAEAILKALGMPEDKVRFAVMPLEDHNSDNEASKSVGRYAESGDSRLSAGAWLVGHDRRALIRQATESLYDRYNAHEPLLPLPAGSPFGTVVVNTPACTLCMACVLACPSGALSAGGDMPQLLFCESRCYQCGLCAESCPERAIEFVPRLVCHSETVEARTILHKAEPFRCIECGVPFASQAMINRIREKLNGHWMYGNERQLRRLQMCRTCRARDVFESTEMKPWDQR